MKPLVGSDAGPSVSIVQEESRRGRNLVASGRKTGGHVLFIARREKPQDAKKKSPQPKEAREGGEKVAPSRRSWRAGLDRTIRSARSTLDGVSRGDGGQKGSSRARAFSACQDQTR